MDDLKKGLTTAAVLASLMQPLPRPQPDERVFKNRDTKNPDSKIQKRRKKTRLQKKPGGEIKNDRSKLAMENPGAGCLF